MTTNAVRRRLARDAARLTPRLVAAPGARQGASQHGAAGAARGGRCPCYGCLCGRRGLVVVGHVRACARCARGRHGPSATSLRRVRRAREAAIRRWAAVRDE